MANVNTEGCKFKSIEVFIRFVAFILYRKAINQLKTWFTLNLQLIAKGVVRHGTELNHSFTGLIAF